MVVFCQSRFHQVIIIFVQFSIYNYELDRIVFRCHSYVTEMQTDVKPSDGLQPARFQAHTKDRNQLRKNRIKIERRSRNRKQYGQIKAIYLYSLRIQFIPIFNQLECLAHFYPNESQLNYYSFFFGNLFLCINCSLALMGALCVWNQLVIYFEIIIWKICENFHTLWFLKWPLKSYQWPSRWMRWSDKCASNI